jgi:hypothetical protein
LIDTRQNLQSIQPTFPETGILFYSTGALIMVCLFFEAVHDSTDYLASYDLNIVSIII